MRRSFVGLAASVALLCSAVIPFASAEASSRNSQKTLPTGTLLIPITPKIDTSSPSDVKPTPKPAAVARPPVNPMLVPQTTPARASNGATSPGANPQSTAQTAPGSSQNNDDGSSLKAAPESISAEQGDDVDGATEVGEDSTLKGTIQLVADDTEYDEQHNTFLGTGNAVVTLAGQNSKLEADTILYDQNSQTIDARGNVRIYRNGQLTTGSSFKFNVTSDEYLITSPDTEVEGTTVIARKGYGSRQGLAFRNGTLGMPNTIHISNNRYTGSATAGEENFDKYMHPDAFLPNKPSYKFKARKMTYERYKDTGNLTVHGGKLMFGSFGVPVPKFKMTVGNDNTRVLFPVTPLITNNFQMGGTSVGPQFNFAEGRTGMFSVAPLVQFGGITENGTSASKSKVGAGVRIGFVNDRVSTHFAYGSNSDLVVADFKLRITDNTKIQAGVNRFLEDGIFGVRRARAIAEVVNYKYMHNIPFLQSFVLRTSGGWAQDNPALLNLTPQYQKLFTEPTNPNQKVAALRVQEQITATTQPIFAVGDSKWGAKMNIFGGIAVRGYSTGDAMAMGQLGPILTVNLDRLRLQGGYTQSGVSGKSPFVFDEFIQGQRSVSISGDLKINKYITVGATQGYNLVDKLSYMRSVTAAIGPEDFKVLLSRDTLRGINRYGFDVLFGQPIPFNKLVLKGGPDAGQLGGI
jgi:hypothetical protein